MPVLPVNIDNLRKIVTERQAYRLRWSGRPKAVTSLVDMQTAHAVVAAYDAVNDDGKARMIHYIRHHGPGALTRIAAIVWNAVPKAIVVCMLFLAGCVAPSMTARDMVRADCGAPNMENIAAYVDCANITLDAIDMQTRIDNFSEIGDDE